PSTDNNKLTIACNNRIVSLSSVGQLNPSAQLSSFGCHAPELGAFPEVLFVNPNNAQRTANNSNSSCIVRLLSTSTASGCECIGRRSSVVVIIVSASSIVCCTVSCRDIPNDDRRSCLWRHCSLATPPVERLYTALGEMPDKNESDDLEAVTELANARLGADLVSNNMTIVLLSCCCQSYCLRGQQQQRTSCSDHVAHWQAQHAPSTNSEDTNCQCSFSMCGSDSGCYRVLCCRCSGRCCARSSVQYTGDYCDSVKRLNDAQQEWHAHYRWHTTNVCLEHQTVHVRHYSGGEPRDAEQLSTTNIVTAKSAATTELAYRYAPVITRSNKCRQVRSTADNEHHRKELPPQQQTDTNLIVSGLTHRDRERERQCERARTLQHHNDRTSAHVTLSHKSIEYRRSLLGSTLSFGVGAGRSSKCHFRSAKRLTMYTSVIALVSLLLALQLMPGPPSGLYANANDAHVMTRLSSSSHTSVSGGGTKHTPVVAERRRQARWLSTMLDDTLRAQQQRMPRPSLVPSMSVPSAMVPTIHHDPYSSRLATTSAGKEQLLDDEQHQQHTLKGGQGKCPAATICTCVWRSGKLSAECARRRLSKVPTELDPLLQVLDLSGNSFPQLPSAMFASLGYIHLQRVYLSSCNVSQINARAFTNLKLLVELDLSHNQLTRVPIDALIGRRLLRKLNLRDNPLVSIATDGGLISSSADVQSNWITGNNADTGSTDYFGFDQQTSGGASGNGRGLGDVLPRLEELDLAECSLEHVDARALGHVPRLRILSLDSNRLKWLSADFVSRLPSAMHELRLDENPWQCDCRLHEAVDLLLRNRISLPVSPRCPNGLKWSAMALDEFVCPPTLLTATSMSATTSIPKSENNSDNNGNKDNQTLVVDEDERFELTCRFSVATPTLQIAWLYNRHHTVSGALFLHTHPFIGYSNNGNQSIVGAISHVIKQLESSYTLLYEGQPIIARATLQQQHDELSVTSSGSEINSLLTADSGVNPYEQFISDTVGDQVEPPSNEARVTLVTNSVSGTRVTIEERVLLLAGRDARTNAPRNNNNNNNHNNNRQQQPQKQSEQSEHRHREPIVDQFEVVSTLSVDHASKLDGGSYKCVGANKAGFVVANRHVAVQSVPQNAFNVSSSLRSFGGRSLSIDLPSGSSDDSISPATASSSLRPFVGTSGGQRSTGSLLITLLVLTLVALIAGLLMVCAAFDRWKLAALASSSSSAEVQKCSLLRAFWTTITVRHDKQQQSLVNGVDNHSTAMLTRNSTLTKTCSSNKDPQQQMMNSVGSLQVANPTDTHHIKDDNNNDADDEGGGDDDDDKSNEFFVRCAVKGVTQAGPLDPSFAISSQLCWPQAAQQSQQPQQSVTSWLVPATSGQWPTLYSLSVQPVQHQLNASPMNPIYATNAAATTLRLHPGVPGDVYTTTAFSSPATGPSSAHYGAVGYTHLVGYAPITSSMGGRAPRPSSDLGSSIASQSQGSASSGDTISESQQQHPMSHSFDMTNHTSGSPMPPHHTTTLTPMATTLNGTQVLPSIGTHCWPSPRTTPHQAQML
ncbi:Chondroadherin-like protein, partial [Fragariocoptes setiger]